MARQITLLKLPTVRTPLSYIGGKTKLIPYIKEYRDMWIKKDIVSPFIGGGALELYFGAHGNKVFAGDFFKPLVNFWGCFIEDPNKLIDIAQGLYNSVAETDDLIEYIHDTKGRWNTAAVYWLVNKRLYRATTYARLYRNVKNDNMVKPKYFDRYRNSYLPNLTVARADYKDLLDDHPTKFAYLDPPYVGYESFYGWGDTTFDHEELRNKLVDRSSLWLLSYNDCKYIRDLYKDFHFYSLNVPRSFDNKHAKLRGEVLISNFKKEEKQ